MELSGTWQALVADDELRRTWLDEPDDAAWEPIEVPSHWRSTPAFSDTDGPLLYRTRFDHARPGPDERHWLVLDGIFYQGDIWLDGGYVGDTEGYFSPHEFEVTEALSARSEHLLGVEATCAPQTDRTAKKNITVKAPVTVAGTGALTLNYNQGNVDGDLPFEKKGKIDFWDTNSSLTINDETLPSE